MPDRTIFSFVVDTRYRFLYEGWQLARSLIKNCGGDPTAVHVQCTPEVPEYRREIFRELGCTVHEMARFGDGKHCNKLNQLENLRSVEFDRVVLLDADTLAIGDIRPFLLNDVIMGKPVDAARPALPVLDEIAAAAGMKKKLEICKTDWGTEGTYIGNCNGGFYSVPKAFSETLSKEWRRWALWLLENLELLSRHDMPQHVDQVSFWLAIHQANLPFANAPANINFFPYIGGPHLYYDPTLPIALVHYHSSLNQNGFLTMRPRRSPHEIKAIQAVNKSLAGRFDNRVFWDFRYERYPGIGAGGASRGASLVAKKQLLKRQGIEKAESILDIGCGDGKVLTNLSLRKYVGIDISHAALERARAERPGLDFRPAPAPNVESADLVLCLEVLPHQTTEADYLALVAFAAQKTRRSLIISGFAQETADIRKDPTAFFHEPLETSLLRTRRFKRLEILAQTGNMVTYRCYVI